jgi:hypothetical protein
MHAFLYIQKDYMFLCLEIAGHSSHAVYGMNCLRSLER